MRNGCLSIITIILSPIILFVLALILVVITSPLYICEHEEIGTIFSFQSENSTTKSSYKPYCKNCEEYFGYTRFIGTPDDLSYLEAVKPNIEGNEVKAGEYQTMTAVVSLADYNADKTRIRCKVENEEVIVGFSVEFRGEFEEQVSFLQEGDEITFRGRLYDNGFGWTDCELLNEER